MATPAARSLQKRYTAGSCTLDVALQLSALSQWYPQPIAQDLQFKLWMNNDTVDAGVATGAQDLPAAGLIAQGDRIALQALSQAVSQKVRGVLAIAHLNSPEVVRSRSTTSQTTTSQTTTSQTDQPLPGLQLTRPLSYLQLCDISSVLYQCEQATPLLPISRPVALSAAVATEPQTKVQTNVVPFAAIRRRPQLWASSAAAALLAVGLTSTLWPSLQPSSEISTSTQSAPSETANSKTAPSNAPENSDDRLTKPNASPRNVENAPSATGDSIGRAPRNTPTAPKTPAAGTSEPPNPATDSPAVESATNAARAPERSAEGESGVAKQPATPSSPNEPNAAATNPPTPNAPAPAAPPPAAADVPPPTARYGTLPETAQSRVANESFSAANTPDASISAASETESGAASADSQALVQQTSLTIEEVQSHFQSQWQAIKPATVSETLSYEIQLSETGEVISFVGLSEAAQAYRSSLIPADRPLIFPVDLPPGSTDQNAGLTLQLKLLPNGQAQVFQ